MTTATTQRYTAKEAVATHWGYDLAEMNDNRYQPTMWTMPVWSNDNDVYSARQIGSKKLPVHRDDRLTGNESSYNWFVVETWKTWEVLKGVPKEDQ